MERRKDMKNKGRNEVKMYKKDVQEERNDERRN